MDRTHEVVGDFVLLEDAGGETQVGRGKARVGCFHIDHRDLGFGRQVATDLVHLGTDFGERLVGVVVQAQPGLDGREALRARRVDVVDAVRRCDGALERRGDESPHELGICTNVGRGDGDDGVLAARVLANIQRADGLETCHEDDEGHHKGKDRLADEDVGEIHGAGRLSLLLGGRGLGGGRETRFASNDMGAIAKLEAADGHDALAGCEAFLDGHQIALPLTEANELLLRLEA